MPGSWEYNWHGCRHDFCGCISPYLRERCVVNNWKKVLAILTCNVVLMSASYTMLMPFLPVYLTDELNADPASVKLWTGAIFAVTFAVCAIMAPIWGKMSDTKGRKLMVIRSSSLIALAYLLSALVATPLQLFLVRILMGFAAGLWPASLTLMSAYAPRNKIGICMGVMQSANICGGIIGPLLGGVLAQTFGMRTSFMIAAAALTFITLVTIFFIKEPPREEAPKASKAQGTYMSLLRQRTIRILLLCCGSATMVILLLQPVLTLYIGELMGTDENLLMISGVVFSLSGISGAIAAPIWGRQGQAKGFFRALVIALFTAGFLLASLFIPNSLLPFTVLNFMVGLGFSGIFPSANAILITQSSPQQRGAALGLLFSAQQIGGAIGPLIGGLIATFVNISSIFLLAGAILMGLSLYIYFTAPPEMRARPDEDERPQRNQQAIDELKRQAAEEVQRELQAELEAKQKQS